MRWAVTINDINAVLPSIVYAVLAVGHGEHVYSTKSLFGCRVCTCVKACDGPQLQILPSGFELYHPARTLTHGPQVPTTTSMKMSYLGYHVNSYHNLRSSCHSFNGNCSTD